MNLEGISKAQRGERYSSPSVYSTTRVPLPLLGVTVRDLLWKHPPWSSELSIILDTRWHLLQKPNTCVYTYLSIALIHTEKPPTLSTVLSHQPFEPSLSIFYSLSLPLSVFVDHASGAQVIQWAETEVEHWWPTRHLFFFKPLIYIFGGAKKQRLYNSPLTFCQITSIL